MEGRWLVAAEHDQGAFECLGTALRDLGYDLSSESWSIGGSQELSEWVVACPHGELLISAETYIGLSVSGQAELISELQRQYEQRLAR